MASKKKVFSDSWDRVSDRHATLLPGVICQSQFYRGEAWRVLRAPYENEFFRLTEEAWGFVGRLSMDVTINEAWQHAMEKDPEGAPGQEEVIEILGQLSSAGLILSDIAADSREIFRSKAAEKKKMMGKQALNFLFLRVPVFNPDRMLTMLRPLGRVFMHPITVMLWLFVIGWGAKSVIENWSLVKDQSSGFLSPDNLFLVLICTIVLKLLHELGHGISCKYFGGYVPTFGIMFVLFSPLPFVDATASWGFRERWRRIFVSAAGMYVELFLAALAAIVWVHAGDGMLKGLAYNVMLIGSVTTLLFNLNPLLKFDGYYILVDVLSLPNLQQRAVKYLQYFLERYGFGRDEADSPADQNGEVFWLAIYGLGSGLYRVFLMFSISMIVGQQFFELGIALAVFTIIVYILVPVLKFFRYILTGRELVHCRGRAFAVVGLALALLIAGLGFIPIPEHYQQPGIIRPVHQVNISAGFDGQILRAPIISGQKVKAGDWLMTLENPHLIHDIAISEASLARLKLRGEVAQAETPAAVSSYRRLADIEEERLQRLKDQQKDLELHAPIDGYWVCQDIGDHLGKWFQKGTVIGQVRNPDAMEFLAVVSQQRAADSFVEGDPEAVGVRLWGEGAETIPLSDIQVIPGGQRVLPSAALGWMGGGAIKVKQDDPEGVQTEERFYLLRGTIESDAIEQDFGLLFDRTGEIRIRFGERPIAIQVWNALRRMVQQRLKI
ncbi:MAG: biotin/lipoyl-binding protein [Opitutaceae bacterium]